MKIPKMDHEQNTLYAAMGLDFYERNIVSNTILFETVSNHLLVNELFDDPKEAPIGMCSMTGILERSLERLEDDTKKFFLTLSFGEIYMAARSAINHNKGNTKMGDYQEKIYKQVVKTHGDPFGRIVKAIKDSSYDYDRFINLTLPIDKRNDINEVGKKIEESSKKGGSSLLGMLGIDEGEDY
jgi:hypothetical protein